METEKKNKILMILLIVLCIAVVVSYLYGYSIGLEWCKEVKQK